MNALRHLWPALLAILLLATRAPAAERLRVVASLADLAAIAREVGGDRVTVSALALSTQDPHHVDPRPHLVLHVNRADLLVHAGLDLEIGWLPTLVRGARNPRIAPGRPGNFDASAVIAVKDRPPGKVDRTLGDVHPAGNPHYLNDPRNGARVASELANRLGALDPAGAAGYRGRAQQLIARSQDLALGEQKRFSTLARERRRIVTYHRTLTYLVDWLDLEVVETLEPKPGIPPDPAHVASVLALIKRSGVPAIVQEAYYPSRTAKLVADRSGARLVSLPGGPDFEAGQTYLDYVQALADRLYSALGGES